MGHFYGKVTERLVTCAQRCLLPVVGNLVGEKIGGVRVGNRKIGDLSTEVMGVPTPSIEAMILCRNHGGQQLTLAATQRGWPMHQRPIEIH